MCALVPLGGGKKIRGKKWPPKLTTASEKDYQSTESTVPGEIRFHQLGRNPEFTWWIPPLEKQKNTAFLGGYVLLRPAIIWTGNIWKCMNYAILFNLHVNSCDQWMA